MKKILAISGSTKNKATSHSILHFIAETYKDIVNIEVYTSIANLPHFNPDSDNDNLPQEVAQLRKKIEDADGLLFCTPEYVFSLPGSLKNLIEWNVSSTLFSGKPVAMIIAAASGEKAFESLGLILTTIEAILPTESKLLIKGAKGKLDANGKIIDRFVLKEIDKLMNSLILNIESDNKQATKFR